MKYILIIFLFLSSTLNAQKSPKAENVDIGGVFDRIGKVFLDSNSEILVKYNEGNWGPIPDSLKALNLIFDKYVEALSIDSGLHKRIQIQLYIAGQLLNTIKVREKQLEKKITPEEANIEITKIIANIKEAVEMYNFYTKTFP